MPARATAMRLDVSPTPDRLDAELDALQVRLPDYLRHARRLPDAPGLPHYRLHVRTADGEHYVYVHDPVTGRLAGCTVFNRLVEIDRRLDPYVRSPHSRYRPRDQRRGLASWIYGHMLASGVCLLSGARQSPAAHALWRALGARFPLTHAQLRRRQLHDLGTSVSPAQLDALETRLLLCGAGWNATRLAGLCALP